MKLRNFGLSIVALEKNVKDSLFNFECKQDSIHSQVRLFFSNIYYVLLWIWTNLGLNCGL